MKNGIYEKIKMRILYLEYEPGTTLDEKEIAKEFGVSRTPVREAVMRLSWERLVEIVSRGGVFVTKIDLPILREVLNIRKSLEGQIARIAAANCNEGHIKALKKLKTICTKTGNFKAPRDLMDIDIQMREILYDATNSPILNQITDMLYCQTFRLWLMLFNKLGMERELKAQIQELDNYIEVMSKHNPDGAEAIGIQLFDNYLERLNLYFSEL
jgi:DNA-binding GntR family transcriptional regulator